MSNPLLDLLFGSTPSRSSLIEIVAPRRTFDDVILPPPTRRALHHALVQIEKHDVLFHRWGLAERHVAGTGLAFNFAGPPGTGKTICAEAVAHALGRPLFVVRHAEMESMWAGNTGKNVVTVFRLAEEEGAVLFFDEADAIAGRRFTTFQQAYQREANAVVSVLLRELEAYPGIVIFATNLASNFDPAFERRIRTHILFEMPGPSERAQIWRAQLHAHKTPLAPDVDFQALAEAFEISGGDIKNAVLHAAQCAVAEPGPDAGKRICQRHFIAGAEAVLAARQAMRQSLFHTGDGASSVQAPLNGSGWSLPFQALQAYAGEARQSEQDQAQRFEALEARLAVLEAAGESRRRRLRQGLLIALVLALGLSLCALVVVLV